MHYQTDILGLFPSIAPTLLANTRRLCDAARAAGVSVYFANLRFSPGYPEVSPLNRNGQGIKQLGLFVDDRLSPELDRQASEPVITAHRASVFFGTDLQVRLSAQGIDSLIMVGIASTGVVLSSVAYASDADFRLYTVKDCCYDPDQVVHEHLFATAFESRTTVLSLADAVLLLAR
ncbi:nicotinamidase-related amidase [Paraburkholderia bryophila]|uniref:Nicotinamidase-related amidase n=2 Tax=Paraburkholderia TaxID=1822464 RepID=A0A7Y9W815_9BURK|nr:nicotinamidase-related amidase [Paraburkholderia bryophila]